MCKYSKNKIYIFVFVYKPKDENIKEKGLGVCLIGGDGKIEWSHSTMQGGVKDVVIYLKGFILGMEKAKELGYEVVELIGSNRSLIANLAPYKAKGRNLMGESWKKFQELRLHFFSCQLRNVTDNKNRIARRLAKIGAGEKIVRKWL